MVSYFKYQRNQRKSALLVGVNIALVFAMWTGTKLYLPEFINQDGTEELLEVVNIAAPIVMFLLALIALYLWVNNKTFLIQITPTTLTVHDPMFDEYSWQVKLQDMQRVGYTQESDQALRRIHVYMQDGNSHQLTQNYRYSRSRFYQALHKAAPHIEIESSLRHFVKLN